jgi:hypothetical protein
MLKKKIFLLLFLILNHCGFTPAYNNLNNSNFTIIIDKTIGDKLINNIISSEINRISKPNSENIFNITLNTSYKKSIISKNAKGTASDYQLQAVTNLTISKNNDVKNISFQERQNIKNSTDIFELKNYENTIKKNFAISIARKINLELINK